LARLALTTSYALPLAAVRPLALETSDELIANPLLFCTQPNDEGFEFDRLGVRVPTIMASPWINKGTVIHAPPEVPPPTNLRACVSLVAAGRN
jgi:hypothetical protein